MKGEYSCTKNVDSIDIRLNPDPAWSSRIQNIQMLGHNQDSNTFTNLVSAKDYTFDPATGNIVSIPVNAKVSSIQLVITSNTGANGAQVAELIVNGDLAPNPDLTVIGMDHIPESPIETDDIRLTAQVKNVGTARANASNVKFYIGSFSVGTVDIPDRCGGDFWTSEEADDKINEYQNFGAIWIYGGDRDLKNIIVRNVDINDPVYFGIQFQTMYPDQIHMNNIRLENININNAPRYGIKLVVKAERGQGPCVGETSFTNVKINNAGIMPVYGIEKCPNFTIYKSGSNNW